MPKPIKIRSLDDLPDPKQPMPKVDRMEIIKFDPHCKLGKRAKENGAKRRRAWGRG